MATGTVSVHASSNPLREDKVFYRALGERLRAARDLKRWSLAKVEEITTEMARESRGPRIPAVVLGSYERGDRRPAPDTIYRLADLFGIKVSQLLPDDPGDGQVMVALNDLIALLSALGSGVEMEAIPVPRGPSEDS